MVQSSILLIMSSGTMSPSQERDLYDLKVKAMEFYAGNGVPQKMEEILNNMFYDAPDDVFGHLANYFESFAKAPVINKIRSREVLESRGQPAIQTDIYCTIKNDVKLSFSSLSPNESYPHDGVKADERESFEDERAKSLSAAIEILNQEMTLALRGLDPRQQNDIDQAAEDIIRKMKDKTEIREKAEAEEREGNETPQNSSPPSETPSKTKGGKSSAKGKKGKESIAVIPDEPREKFFPGSNAIGAISLAVCQAAAAANNMPLYQHIASLKSSKICSYKVPVPMVTIISSGKGALGKLNCIKEYMVVPKNLSLDKAVKHISDIYYFCARALCAKGGNSARYVNDTGALCPVYDRPEQGLDMLQEALTNLDLTEKFSIALNCAAHEIFDLEKGKYELMTGQLKPGEDLVDFWADILNRYPSVNVLIDPMRRQEAEAWMKLCGTVSEKCLIFGNAVYHRPGILKDEEILQAFKSSGIIMQTENVNTITDIITVAKKYEEAAHHVIVGVSSSDSTDTFAVDLAVGIQASFIKLGAPCRGERVMKLNRLVQIEAELGEKSVLQKAAELAYPVVRPPSPPVEEEVVPQTPDSKKSKK